MAGRLTTARIAGVAAWTAATVTWGTAAIAITQVDTTADAAPEDNPTASASTTAIATPSIPDMPERGLVIVRYTPIAKPEAEVIIEQRVITTPRPAGTQPTTTSSGS